MALPASVALPAPMDADWATAISGRNWGSYGQSTKTATVTLVEGGVSVLLTPTSL